MGPIRVTPSITSPTRAQGRPDLRSEGICSGRQLGLVGRQGVASRPVPPDT